MAQPGPDRRGLRGLVPRVRAAPGVLDMVAVAGMALFGFGLYLLVNVLLAQQARLLALRRLSDL